jgi:hypothetical protein
VLLNPNKMLCLWRVVLVDGRILVVHQSPPPNFKQIVVDVQGFRLVVWVANPILLVVATPLSNNVLHETGDKRRHRIWRNICLRLESKSSDQTTPVPTQ